MSDTDSELNGAMEATEITGEFKLRALNNNKLFYFSKIIIQKTLLCAARRFRQCAIIDNTNFMTCTRLHPNYNTNLPLDGVKEENERAATPTQRNPLSRAPTQWRNVTIWCPPAHFLPPPQIFYFLQKKKKKKKKKGRHFFFGFSYTYRLLAPWSFLYPQIIFSRRPNAKLAEIWYILLLCQKIFRLKNCKFGNMPPP